VSPPAEPAAPGGRLLELVAVMDRLRTQCPWDARQTHESLTTYLVEETYEAVEAVETGDRDHLREELGDLLLQIVFHARIAEEHPSQPWDINDVAAGIVDKLIRRHPHVFADTVVADAEEVQANWEQLKAGEKQRTSALDGVPLGLPALTLAAKLLDRAARSGLDVGSASARVAPAPYGVDAERVGAALFELVSTARAVGVDPEQALRAHLRQFADQVRAAEQTG
jgi:XTP/dITP diphosphohydrolase